MPFQMKVQPVDGKAAAAAAVSIEALKPAAKSRLKRLFERQFQSVLRISTAEKGERDNGELTAMTADIEPSSLCLDNMVMSFIEEGNNVERPPRGCCNCFNANQWDDSSDDDFADAPPLSVSQQGDALDKVKSLMMCASVTESNLLSDALKIAEKVKNLKDKDERLRIIAEGLCALGYNSSLCKSKWEITASTPAGEHCYIDVIVENGRLILDIDFKSEFEIARSTKSYRTILQQLPSVFVGTVERLQQIVIIVSDAARQSLKKKGLHVPPWRKCEYMKAKWLSSYQRTTAVDAVAAMEESISVEGVSTDGKKAEKISNGNDVLGFLVSDATFSVEVENLERNCREVDVIVGTVEDEKSDQKNSLAATPLLWIPPRTRLKSGVKVVTGLASVLR